MKDVNRAAQIERELRLAIAKSPAKSVLQVFVGGPGWVMQIDGVGPEDLYDLLDEIKYLRAAMDAVVDAWAKISALGVLAREKKS